MTLVSGTALGLNLGIPRILGLAVGNKASLTLQYTGTPTMNQNFTVPLLVNSDSASIAGVDVQLAFNPQQLRLVAVEPSPAASTTLRTFVPDITTISTTANQTGTVRFSALTFDGTRVTNDFVSTEPVVLVNITFTPLVSGPVSVKWNLAGSHLVTDNLPPVNILNTTTDLNINVSPTITPTGTGISNPGFEDGSLSGWQNTGASVVSTGMHTGSYAAVISGLSNYLSQNIASLLSANTPYTFTVWVKVNTAGTSWGTPMLRMSKYADLGSGDFGQSASSNSTANGWQQLSVTHTFTPADLTGNVYMGVKNFGFTGAENVDDFGVTSGVSPATPTPTPTPTLTPTPTPTPSPTPTPTVQTITMNATIANQDGSGFSASANWFGTGSNTSASYLGMRFSGVNIPKGAKISAATMQVQAASTQWIAVSAVVAGENSGNSVAFSSSALPGSRTLTGASVNYSDNVQWQSGYWYSLGDVSSLVSSIVNRSDWASGNALSIIAKGNGQAFGRKSISGAKISITYIQ